MKTCEICGGTVSSGTTNNICSLVLVLENPQRLQKTLLQSCMWLY